jgi:hypothetical protein
MTTTLLDQLEDLPPWTTEAALSMEDWDHMKRVAEVLQKTPADAVVSALTAFARWCLDNPSDDDGYENESRVFLVMRITFEIPENAPASQRFAYKGWVNWQEPDESGNVNLAWPVAWNHGRPTLLAPYAGSQGLPYDPVVEYEFLSRTYPYRAL